MTDTFTAADLDAIHKQIAELAEQIDWQISIRNELLNKCQEQQARITDLETALALYADPATWVTTPGVGAAVAWATAGGRAASRASADRGERARKALKGGE